MSGSQAWRQTIAKAELQLSEGEAAEDISGIADAVSNFNAALKLAPLIRRPILSGTIFGLGLYVFMYHVVIPLSAVPKNPHAAFSWPNFADEIFAHIVLVGIPIALMAQRSARVKPLSVRRAA